MRIAQVRCAAGTIGVSGKGMMPAPDAAPAGAVWAVEGLATNMAASTAAAIGRAAGGKMLIPGR